MRDIYEMLWDMVAEIMRLAFFSLVMMIILQYTILNIVAFKTIQEAEKDGRFTYSKYENFLSSVTFDTSDIVVESISPDWNEYVEKLGDPVSITIVKPFKIDMFDRVFIIRARRNGINHGYYGRGY